MAQEYNGKGKRYRDGGKWEDNFRKERVGKVTPKTIVESPWGGEEEEQS